MAKSTNPLFSFDARGTIAKALTFRRRGHQVIAETKPIPKDAKTSSQLAWRTMYQKCTDLWHTLSGAEKQTWEALARRQHMTGYNYYMSLCLKPNPGVYLPLAGGTMQGNIDMATNRILNLPAPVADEEPLRKVDGGGGGYTEGARVYNNASLVIPNATFTPLTFNTERYDTDNIHSTASNTSRLTCKTAGKYLITGNAYFAINATGRRLYRLLLNGATPIAQVSAGLNNANRIYLVATTIWDMSVNDYVEFLAWQNSGGNLNVIADSALSPEFSMQRIG